MGRHASLHACVADLEAHGQLVRIAAEIDPDLEAAEIHRRVHDRGGPALLFERLRGTRFPALSNLFGTLERARFVFRDTLARVGRAIEARADPLAILRAPHRHLDLPWSGWLALPREVSDGPVLAERTTISALPRIRAWPGDGGAFVTLPQVYTEDPERPGPLHANLGMYRIQLSGNAYEPDREVGLHYQIHRGIGVHHAAALGRGERLRVSVFVGGPPAHALAAVMPLPEGLSELTFAGMLAGRAFRHTTRNGHRIATDADFCIVGTVDPERTLPEGPFGDHLGYYSLAHPFPVLRVEAVHHRRDAIWPFTVVGRPPQEDSVFGRLVHDLAEPMVSHVVPGLRGLHAVDAAGVHPLLLAIGSERYVPWGERRPQELLTIANAVLGFGQASLAKYLWIAAGEDRPPSLDDVAGFLGHVLARLDLGRDLHFHTCTTMDTLDYSGTGLNAGSKLVIAAAGAPRRTLATELPGELRLPPEWGPVRWVAPGIAVIGGPAYADRERAERAMEELCAWLSLHPVCTGEVTMPLLIVVDDVERATALRDWLWITFTRSDPAMDVHGVGAFTDHKHWGCRGSLVVDARRKPHHAPPLEPDPAVARRVDALAAKGGPLHGLF